MSIPGFFNFAGDLSFAITAATISVLIGGILFGVGIGFGFRRMRIFGAEEIAQGIISSAMVGALAVLIAAINGLFPYDLSQEMNPQCIEFNNITSMPFSYYVCNLDLISKSSNQLGLSLSRSANIAGFASSLDISIGVISVSPFFSLKSASETLSESSVHAYQISSIAFFESELAKSISFASLIIFLPIGLVLRTFFVTRKLGAAAMAISISAYVIYPLVFLFVFNYSPTLSLLSEAIKYSEDFNAKFASIPLMEIDETSGVKDAIDEMAGKDFSGQIQPIFPISYSALSMANADLIFYPAISIIITAISALEIYGFLSAQIFVPYIEIL